MARGSVAHPEQETPHDHGWDFGEVNRLRAARPGALVTPSWSAANVSVCGRGGGRGAFAGIPARGLAGASAAGLASAVATGSAGVASRGKKLAVLVPAGAAFVRQMRATAS